MSSSRRSGFVRVMVTAFAVVGALGVVGCGSDGGTSESGASSTGATSVTTSGVAAASTVTVTVDDMKFSPAAVTVKAGDTVTWKFEDKAPHSVQGIGDAAMGINSPIFTTGEWSHTFTVPGTYRYLCPLHPEMKGTVTVQ
ncbi:plastocyanin/azurin family copper-binding protein [Nocardia sp. NPDC050406]|uniref:plastocyanin/azurin family copper-binding protein n=1 Tax=Nocardia sp. NPDC050406 TaxID=3364318 RepID=UPI0037B2AB95